MSTTAPSPSQDEIVQDAKTIARFLRFLRGSRSTIVVLAAIILATWNQYTNYAEIQRRQAVLESKVERIDATVSAIKDTISKQPPALAAKE